MILTISMPLLHGYKMQLLDHPHLEQMLALQEEILEWLPPGKRNYLVPNDESSFVKHLFRPHMAIGIFHEEMLVGQTMVSFVDHGTKEKKITICDASQKIIDQHPEFAVIGGVIIKPEHHGKGLMQPMLQTVVAHYHAFPVLSEVAIGNDPSEHNFIKAGFEIVGEGIDPTDYCALRFMQYFPKRLPAAVMQ